MAHNNGAGLGQQNANMNTSSAGRVPAEQQAAQQAGQQGRPVNGYGQKPQGRATATGAQPVRQASRAAGAQGGKGGFGAGGNSALAGSGADANRQGQPGQPGSKRTVLMVIGVVVAALVIWLLVWLFACNGNSLLDATAQDGQAPYKTEAEMQAELDRVVEEGMFNISIQSTILFENGSSSGTANIENVPGNHYNMQVAITDDDTGDLLYESGVLKPNQFIEKITLAKDLDAGTYNATATFTALDETTFEEIGQAAAKVIINVVE